MNKCFLQHFTIFARIKVKSLTERLLEGGRMNKKIALILTASS